MPLPAKDKLQDETVSPQQEELSFDTFGLKDLLLKGIEAAGFTTPSPIQAKVIPMILGGADLVAQSQTGTGKTAAFGLAALNLINPHKTGDLLVMTPTRELSMQVADELVKLGKFLGIQAVSIYGGSSGPKQIEKLQKGAQIVVATPGRLLDHLKAGRLKNFSPSIVVLDEADQMLDMGFIDDIREILSYLPKERQSLLFSATMPEPIVKLCQEYLNKPIFVNVTKKFEANVNIEQCYHIVDNHKRPQALVRLIELHQPAKCVIFCRTKKDVEEIREHLTLMRGEFIHALHGDMEQRQREKVIEDFRNGKITILVATDVAARGINVIDISHVINYHPPFDKENYVHRIGRTARAGRFGVAISLVSPSEKRKFDFLQKSLGQAISFKPLPSKEEMKQAMIAKLISELETCKVPDDIHSIMHQFANISSVKEKLVSMFLKQKGFFQIEAFKDLKEDEYVSSSRKDRGFKEKRSFSSPRRSFSDKGDFTHRRHNRSDRPDKFDRSDREDKSFNRKEKPNRSERGAKSFDRFERSNRPEKSFDRAEKSFDRAEKSDRFPKKKSDNFKKRYK